MAVDVRAILDEAHAYAGKGKWKNAADAYTVAVKKAPHNVAARQKLAEALVKLGRTEDAVEQYQHVVGRYAADGFQLKAMAICKLILRLDPKHTLTQQKLAEMYASGGSASASRLRLPPSMLGAVVGREEAGAATDAGHALDMGMMGKAAPEPAEAVPPVEVLPGVEDLDAAVAPPAEVLEEPAAPAAEATIEVGTEDSEDEVVVQVPALPPIPLFSDLTPEAYLEVLGMLEMHGAQPGQVLMEEGQLGDSMFIVVQGAVDVQRLGPDGQPKKLARMTDGAFFGEMALMSKAPRMATVMAAQECVLLELSRSMLDQIITRHPSVGDVLERFYRQRMLLNLIRSNPIFRSFTAPEKEQLAREFQAVTTAPGMQLLEQGQPGAGFYVILRGECEASTTSPDGYVQKHPVMREGDFFGEISLVYDKLVTATVQALTPGLVFWLAPKVFKQLAERHPDVREEVASVGKRRMDRTWLSIPLDMDVDLSDL